MHLKRELKVAVSQSVDALSISTYTDASKEGIKRVVFLCGFGIENLYADTEAKTYYGKEDFFK